MKDLSKKIIEVELISLDPYRTTREEVLSEDTFKYINAIENEFLKESILLYSNISIIPKYDKINK